jgi:TolB-like protein/AraC-like DNA-binding protein
MPGNSKHIRLSLKDQKLLDKALQIVSDHVSDESFGIEELRQGLGLSRSQLHRRLLKITGVSASLFIRSVRLIKAFELLKEGNLSVSEVAYQTGFSSPSYFNKCFHEQYGFPPGDIHKQIIAKVDQRNIFKPKQHFDANESTKVEFNRRKLYLYGILILVAIVFATIYFTTLKPLKKTRIQEKSIAVLPFKNFSDDQENQYISDGMMEAILTNISKIGDIRAISRTSVEQYRESSKPAKQIGLELGVRYLLEGSTFQDEDHVRITVQLIDSKTDEHVWSESYDSELQDIFTFQGQIARSVANELQSKITPDELIRIERIPSTNPKAYDLYQRGQYYFINYLQERDEQNYRKSRSLFSSTIKEDTTFSAAYTRLADLYWMKNYRREYYSDTFMDTVFLLCRKALDFDPQSSDAHRLLGQYYFETGDREQGITELETAIDLNRNNASAYETLGFYYNWIGNWETGIPDLLKSIQLDPYSIMVPLRYDYLARAYLDILDFKNTFFYSQRALESGEGRKEALAFAHWVNAHTHLILGNSQEALNAAEMYSEFNQVGALRIEAEVYCHLLKDYETGIDIYQELTKRDPDHYNYRHRYAYALWETGEYDSAKLMFDDQIKAFEKELELGRVERNDPHYNLAGIYAFLKDYDKAFEHLKKHKFTSGLEIYVEKDPLFKDLYDEEEFKKIIQSAIEEKELLKDKIEKIVAENFGI